MTLFHWLDFILLILLILLVLSILLILLPFHIFMKISQTINTIIRSIPLSSKYTFYHQNKTKKIYKLCNLLWILFILCLIKYLLSKTSTYSLCLMFLTTFLLPHFSFLSFSLLTITKEYIFGLNSTNSLVIFFEFIFYFTNSFLFIVSKNVERFGYSLKSNKFLFS